MAGTEACENKFDLPEIGESDLGNPLPWDTVPAAKFTETRTDTLPSPFGSPFIVLNSTS